MSMDRTAWIAVVVSAAGLVVWYSYMARQTLPRPTSGASGTQTTLSASPPPLATPDPAATVASIPQPAVPVSTFPEARETLRNSDVELHLTNRGGGIAEAVLLNHKTSSGPVRINAGDHIPIGAIVDNPAAPALPEYKMTRQGDAVQYEFVSPEQVTVRKKYFFEIGRAHV